MGNIILGIIIGIILFFIAMCVIAKLDENNIIKQVGEDCEFVLLTKSDKEKIKELFKKEEEKL